MKKHILGIAIVFAMFSCSHHNESIEESTIQQKEILSKKEINSIIETSLQKTGDFNWTEQDVNTIFSALQHGNNILTIGYGTSKENFERSLSSEIVKEGILTLISSTEKSFSKKKREIYADDKINVIDVKVNNKETLIALLNDKRVRYIEPADYSFFDNNQTRLPAGCGYKKIRLKSDDYRTITPKARVPWSFDLHNIPEAWDYSTGSGVTVAIIDTGLSPEQKLMNKLFNHDSSSGRSVEKFGTFVDSWWAWSNDYDGVDDKCGHGTSMASVATAPRNNKNLPVGVAYNANLVSYRAVENVLINDYHEKRGVAEALTALGNREDVKVISMSIGSPFSISRVEDAIKYAYDRGKMIIAAGGTSTSYTTWYGVIFPASMSETVAVTGVKEGIDEHCDICHYGEEIDFTIQMQRTNGTDNKVPVLSYYNGKSDYVGGSSIATAATAGIAALVWSKYPNWSRSQVLEKMKQSSEYYPTKHSEYGYGNIDALKAVK